MGSWLTLMLGCVALLACIAGVCKFVQFFRSDIKGYDYTDKGDDDE